MSRPRKQILIVCENEDWAGAMRLVLETRGHYAATVTTTAAEAWLKLMCNSFDLLIMLGIVGYPRTLLDTAKGVHVPSLVVLREGNLRPLAAPTDGDWGPCLDVDAVASGVLAPPLATNLEVLEAVRMLTAKKRGPRPKAPAVEREPAMTPIAKIGALG